MSQNMHPYSNGGVPEEKEIPASPRESDDLPAPEGLEDIENALKAEEAKASLEGMRDAEEANSAARELEDMRLRMAAEMDNFKKRLNREHQDQIRYASEKVLSDLLPALDNLDLALQYGSQNEACKDMVQGIEMTRRQLLEAVSKSGLLSVGQKGEVFNPEIHEAIGMETVPDQEKGTVSRVLQRGYKLNDRLLRPAKVMVNN